MDSARVYKRQNLQFIQLKASGAERTLLTTPEKRLQRKDDQAAGRENREFFRERKLDVSNSPLNLEELRAFLVDRGPMPVCTIVVNVTDTLAGEPLHPPGVNQEKGSVKVQRMFGGMRQDEFVRSCLLDYYTPEELAEADTHVYTYGTAQGFVLRLQQQMARPTKSVLTYGPFKRNRKQVVATLREHLPFSKQKYQASGWPKWSSSIEELFMHMKTSSISSAGPPFWKEKPVVMETILYEVLPLIVNTIANKELETLRKAQPELFLVEIKNKLDRYERSKLDKKNRPYGGMGFHFQSLFSMLSQPFTEGLMTFDEGRGSNAYGFSYCHGGGSRLWERVRKLRPGQYFFYAYGDDVDFWWCEKDPQNPKSKRLFRASPDFKQMDGSVDSETVKCTLQYLLEEMAQANNTPLDDPVFEFWKAVCELWVEFALNPRFIVDGTTTFQKKQAEGLITGVVGTTLFDTAKSVLAYSEFVDRVKDGSVKDLHNAAVVTRYFLDELGLEIKAGTWDPQLIPLDPPLDQPLPNKFLGVQIMPIQAPNGVEFVPYLSEKEWLTHLLTPRDNPRPQNKVSDTAQARVRFDRMRGLLVTGAIFHPNIARVIGSIINTIPAVAVLMEVQAAGGTGEAPEMVGPLGMEDFRYPNSHQVPTLDFVKNIYFSEENQIRNASMKSLFPSIEPQILALRDGLARMLPRVVRINPKELTEKTFSQIVASQPEQQRREVPEMLPEAKYSEAVPRGVPPARVVKAKEGQLTLDRVLDASVERQISKDPERRMPTATEEIWGRLLGNPFYELQGQEIFDQDPSAVGGFVSCAPLWHMALQLGRTEKETALLAKQAGLFVIGGTPALNTLWVSTVPWKGAAQAVKESKPKIEAQEEYNKEHFKNVITTTSSKQRVQNFVLMAGTKDINPPFIPEFGTVEKVAQLQLISYTPYDGSNPQTQWNWLVNNMGTNGYRMNFETAGYQYVRQGKEKVPPNEVVGVFWYTHIHDSGFLEKKLMAVARAPTVREIKALVARAYLQDSKTLGEHSIPQQKELIEKTSAVLEKPILRKVPDLDDEIRQFVAPEWDPKMVNTLYTQIAETRLLQYPHMTEKEAEESALQEIWRINKDPGAVATLNAPEPIIEPPESFKDPCLEAAFRLERDRVAEGAVPKNSTPELPARYAWLKALDPEEYAKMAPPARRTFLKHLMEDPAYVIGDYRYLPGEFMPSEWRYIRQIEAMKKGRNPPRVAEGHPLRVVPPQVLRARTPRIDWAQEEEDERVRKELVGALIIQQQTAVEVIDTPDGPTFRPGPGYIHLVDSGLKFEGRNLIFHERGVPLTMTLDQKEKTFYVLRKAKDLLFKRRIPGPIRFELTPRETKPYKNYGANRNQNGGWKPPTTQQQKAQKWVSFAQK